MKFSESWLREWVSPTLETNALCEQLSMAGLEVDSIESVAGDFSGVVVGEVVECGQHPNADKLRVTKINVGEDDLLDIVCGAPNCRQGIKVAVAKVGAVLPGNFKIKKAKLRGEPSFGMLCSVSELGMGEDHSGILELPQDAPIGQDIRDYLSLNDKTIEIDLTPNRADCLGISGVARELGVLNQLDVVTPRVNEVPVESNASRDINLLAPEACPRYLGRVIEDIDMSAQSPLWLKEKLRRSGIRSIDPVDAILGKARQYGLHTDASHRYERGVDPELQLDAMHRASELLINIVGGKAGPIVEAVSQDHLPKRNKITLRQARLNKVLGKEIDTSRVKDMLQRLGMQVEAVKNDYTVTAPSYRFDISIEEDLIEEVARIYGYNNIENIPPIASLNINAHPESKLALASLKHLLVNQGFQEAITYSFVDPKKQALLFPDQHGLLLEHPISSDMSVMRVSLLPGLLGALSYNQKRQQANIRLFESGLVFKPDAEEKTGVQQIPSLAAVMCGNTHDEHWSIASTALDFFDAKAVCEQLLSMGGQYSVAKYEFKKANIPAYHPGQCAHVLRDGKVIGVVGQVHPQHAKKCGFGGKVYALELELAPISRRSLPSAKPISKFPMNRRDLAITVKEELETGKLIESIEKIGISDLVSINLFDVYQGQGIEPGYKSLAISIWLQSTEMTLQDSDIQQSVDTVVNHLQEHFSATLRD